MRVVATAILIYCLLCAVLLAGKRDMADEMLYIMGALLMAIYLAR